MHTSMVKLSRYARNMLALVGALALGWYLGSGSSRTVKAASTDFEFQLAQVNETSSLLVYQPSHAHSLRLQRSNYRQLKSPVQHEICARRAGPRHPALQLRRAFSSLTAR